MPKTLLQMVQAAELELGLPQSVSVFSGTTDSTGQQLGSLANRVLDELRRMHRWVNMQFEYIIVVNVPISVTANSAPESFQLTGISPNTTGVLANYFTVTGPNLNQAARVASVDSATQVTMNMESTNLTPLTGGTYLFCQDTYPMPQGFDWMNNRTMWDRTNRWELLGPDSPQLDQWHRSGIVATGPRRHFRQIGPFANQFRIWPPPAEITSPLQLVFEYLTINAVMVHGSPSTFAQYFVNDDDQPILDDQSIIMGIKWMFWEIKGFGSYVTLQSRWVDYVERQMARDGSAPTLNLVKRQNPIFLSPSNVQDGFFPGPTSPNSA